MIMHFDTITRCRCFAAAAVDHFVGNTIFQLFYHLLFCWLRLGLCNIFPGLYTCSIASSYNRSRDKQQ